MPPGGVQASTVTSRRHLRHGGQAFGACRKATGYLSGVVGAQQLNSIRQISGNCANGLFVSILNLRNEYLGLAQRKLCQTRSQTAEGIVIRIA